jgi:hypothetical protein
MTPGAVEHREMVLAVVATNVALPRDIAGPPKNTVMHRIVRWATEGGVMRSKCIPNPLTLE